MKKLLTIFCFSVLLLWNTSCKKSLLDKNPTDQISSETFWKTADDVQIALTGVYSIMTTTPAMNFWRCTWDGLSDIGYGYGNLNDNPIVSTTGGLVSGIYSDCYAGISRCNIFLANVDRAAAAVDKSVLSRDKAEVLFLRSEFYFTLTEFYGGVPLYTEPPTIDNSKVAQSTKEAVVAQILADLDIAIADLPDEAYTGHAVKASALALKAQVLMFNQKWAEGAAAAKQIIASGKFSLYNNYTNLFLAKGQDNNPEIIFSVRYLLPDAGNFAGNASPEQLWAHGHSLSPIQQFVDAFECTDGLPITQSSLYDPSLPFKNRDPRLVATVIDFADYTAKGTPIGETGETWQTPYSVEKMVDWSTMPVSWAQQSDQDYILFRYAQVLLIYAECQNEAVGPDQSVYDAVNMIRERPSVNMPPLPAGLDQVAMRQRIRHEREVELGMEGLRYWDIKRWKTAETVLPLIKDPGGHFRIFDPTKNYVWPFPQSELDVNPNLVQNPGY